MVGESIFKGGITIENIYRVAMLLAFCISLGILFYKMFVFNQILDLNFLILILFLGTVGLFGKRILELKIWGYRVTLNPELENAEDNVQVSGESTELKLTETHLIYRPGRQRK